MPGFFAQAPSWHLKGDFWKFWSGQTISTLGSSVTGFALPLLVFKLTNSPLNHALTMVFTILPYLLFGLVIGAWIDRINRKRVITFTRVLTWPTGSLGVLLGGLVIAHTGNVGLVYGCVGLLVFLVAFAFWFTPLGHAERYMPETEAAHGG